MSALGSIGKHLAPHLSGISPDLTTSFVRVALHRAIHGVGPLPPAAKAADGFASVTIGRDGTCIANAAASVADGELRLALGCVDAVPVVVSSAGTDEESVRQAVAGANLEPPSDVHASAEYRRHLAGVCAVRAVRQATGEGG